MKKLGFSAKNSSKGNVYFVKRIMADELKHEGEQLATQILTGENEPVLPF